MSTSSSKFSASKPGRDRRYVRTSHSSASIKSPRSISRLRFTAHGSYGDFGGLLSSTSLTAFEIKKRITSKQLQNEQICALTVSKNLIYLATKSGKISIFEERMNTINDNNQSNKHHSSQQSQRSHVKHKKSAV
mgnify:CR=1 FL=1